jgi:hypothetical protein
MEEYFHAFLTWTVGTGGWLASRPLSRDHLEKIPVLTNRLHYGSSAVLNASERRKYLSTAENLSVPRSSSSQHCHYPDYAVLEPTVRQAPLAETHKGLILRCFALVL